MNREQARKLKIGDLVKVRNGRDAGRIGEVVFIQDDVLLIRSTDRKRFRAAGSPSCRPGLRLTGYTKCDLLEED